MNPHSTMGSTAHQAVDGVDAALEGAGAIEHAGIGEQVHDHIGPDGNDAREGMQSAKQKLVAFEKSALRGGLRGLVHIDPFGAR